MSLLEVFGSDDPNFKPETTPWTTSNPDVKCVKCHTTDSSYFRKAKPNIFYCVEDDFFFQLAVFYKEIERYGIDEVCEKQTQFPSPPSSSASSSPTPFLPVPFPSVPVSSVPFSSTQECEYSSEASKSKYKKLYVKKTCPDAGYPLAKPVLLKPVKNKGVYFQIGDIVALTDGEADYYAQVRGLFMDQYGQSYAVITWLLPTITSPKGKFDPDSYVFGHDENFLRKLEEMTFVCNAPNESYMSRGGTYPSLPPLRAEFGVLFKDTGPEIVKLLPDEEYYNPYDKSPTLIESTSRKILSSLPKQKKGKRDSKRKC